MSVEVGAFQGVDLCDFRLDETRFKGPDQYIAVHHVVP